VYRETPQIFTEGSGQVIVDQDPEIPMDQLEKIDANWSDEKDHPDE